MLPPATYRRRSYDHFENYRTDRDERLGADGFIAAHQQLLIEELEALSPGELKARQQRINRAADELGLHFSLRDEKRPTKWDLDLFPRIIEASEWNTIERAVIQRLRTFNAFLADIYGPKNILHDGRMPINLVLGDLGFRREVHDLRVPDGNYIMKGAVDLIRGADGRWTVLEHHFSTPTGMSYVLQNRRLLAQGVPEFFDAVDVEPVSEASTRLAEAMRATSQKARPFLVSLAQSETNASYFEESFLARHMGMPLVKAADLLVRDSRLWVKTIAGLEPVDVVLRRIPSDQVDPIAFNQELFQGVPGFVNCVRANNLNVINAMGCGVADSRWMLRYSDFLTRYYLHEEPVLRTLETFNCIDPDQRSYVADKIGDMVVKPVHDALLKDAPKDADGGVNYRTFFEEQPWNVVAQPYVLPSQVPRFEDGQFTPRSAVLRVFVIGGQVPFVLPGGLSLQAAEPSAPLNLAENHSLKDTWVLKRNLPKVSTPFSLERELDPGDFPLGSRAAETLYWIGRYLDRAENTARMLLVLEEIGLDELSPRVQQSYWPLWRAAAAACGMNSIAKRKAPPKSIARMTKKLLADLREPGSIVSTISAAASNADQVRDFISPEFWRVIHRLNSDIRAIAALKRPSAARLVDGCTKTVDEIARALGTGIRTMQHDASWTFFVIGGLYERAVAMLTIVDHTLPVATYSQMDHLADDTDLTSLLRLMGCLDAYRREYRSRAYVDRVASLIWQNTTCTSSAYYCLKCIRGALAGLADVQPGEPARRQPLDESLREILRELDGIPVQSLFPARATELDKGQVSNTASPEAVAKRVAAQSKRLREATEAVHGLIEDTYFNHQITPPRPVQQVAMRQQASA